MIKCCRCKQFLPETEFYSVKQGYCKACARQYKRDTYDPLKRKLREIKLQYNISIDEYERLIEKGCFCGSKENLVIDHDHSCCPERKRSCGKCVRGALCANHNVLLGMAGDDILILKKAMEYLEEYNATERDP